MAFKATIGLNQRAVDRVRMGSGQGLVGAAMATRQRISGGRASQNPRFRDFPEADKPPYDALSPVSRSRPADRMRHG